MKSNVFMIGTLLGVVLLIFTGQPAYAQGCDAQLKPVDNQTIQYRARGNRCEGFYSSTVSAPYLDVVGLIDGKFRFESNDKETIEISAPLIKNQPVAIRAVGIPLKTYYRMDAHLDPGQTLTWSVKEVLVPNKLASSKIGVFGWIEQTRPQLYVPVTATSTLKPIAPDGKIRLYLRASVDVINVQWRSADVVDGNCAAMSAWNKLAKTSYYTGEAIEIILPTSATGAVCIEVTAQDKNDAQWLPTPMLRVAVRR